MNIQFSYGKKTILVVIYLQGKNTSKIEWRIWGLLEIGNNVQKVAVLKASSNSVVTTSNMSFKGQLQSDVFVKTPQNKSVAFGGILFNDEPKLFKTNLKARNLAENFLAGDVDAIKDLKNLPHLDENEFKAIKKYLVDKLVETTAQEPTLDNAKLLLELGAIAQITCNFINARGEKRAFEETFSPAPDKVFINKITKEYELNRKVLEYLISFTDPDKKVDDSPVKPEHLREMVSTSKLFLNGFESDNSRAKVYSKILALYFIKKYGEEKDLNILVRDINSPSEHLAVKLIAVSYLVEMAERLKIGTEAKNYLMTNLNKIIDDNKTHEKLELECFRAIKALNEMTNK